MQNQDKDIIRVRAVNGKINKISTWDSPYALWGVVVRSSVYVATPIRCQFYAGDIFPHFVLFDSVPDEKIGELDRLCYIHDKSNRHFDKCHNSAEQFNMLKKLFLARK